MKRKNSRKKPSVGRNGHENRRMNIWSEKIRSHLMVKSSKEKRIILLVSVLAVFFLGRFIFLQAKKPAVSYETAFVQKGLLISSISGSGTITSGNYTNVTTRTLGTVKKLFVINGATVQKGQKIAEIELDDYARERQAAAWVAYLEATEAVKEAEKAKVTADITMWQSRESLLNAQEDVNDYVGDTAGEKMIIAKSLDEARLSFALAELKYKNADSDIANAQAKVSAALRNYQENSATIIAPATGTITDLALAEGIIVSASSAISSTSGATIVSAQTVGKINAPEGRLIATVGLTEIDIVNVKANQKVTLVLDAYEDKTFTGKVMAVNTSGSSNSGVTTYPVTIILDPVSLEIYPNMAVSVEIITGLKNDVLLVPTAALQTVNNESVVEVLKDGQVSTVPVEIGEANDSQTEIVSGLGEGDEVITATMTMDTAAAGGDDVSSPFSGINRSGSTFRSTGGFPAGGPPGGF